MWYPPNILVLYTTMTMIWTIFVKKNKSFILDDPKVSVFEGSFSECSEKESWLQQNCFYNCNDNPEVTFRFNKNDKLLL